MSVMRYLYGPVQRNVLPVFLIPRAAPPYPPPPAGEGKEGRIGGAARGRVGIVADIRRLPHLTSGSTSNWWNGGGDGRVHSRVVAPGPHGLLAALSLRMKARTIP